MKERRRESVGGENFREEDDEERPEAAGKWKLAR